MIRDLLYLGSVPVREYMKQLLSMTTALGLLVALEYKPTDRHPLRICFRNSVGGRVLKLSTGVYRNQFGESFSVEQFKYYISAIGVTDQQGGQELLTHSRLSRGRPAPGLDR
jgi:hypothetical protein